MRVQLYPNKHKALNDESPDYIVMQRQRLSDNVQEDGTVKGYETVEVGYGYKQQTPDGETYIDITLKGFGTNNKP